MRELQELPQPDRSGEPDGRQIVLVHLIARDQLAALQFRQRRSHDASSEALAAIGHRCHDAADAPMMVAVAVITMVDKGPQAAAFFAAQAFVGFRPLSFIWHLWQAKWRGR
jgi:hypothetical protein